jgi:hypothetical protein
MQLRTSCCRITRIHANLLLELPAYGLEFFTEVRSRRVQKLLAHGRIIKSGGQLLHDRMRLCLVTR